MLVRAGWTNGLFSHMTTSHIPEECVIYVRMCVLVGKGKGRTCLLVLFHFEGLKGDLLVSWNPFLFAFLYIENQEKWKDGLTPMKPTKKAHVLHLIKSKHLHILLFKSMQNFTVWLSEDIILQEKNWNRFWIPGLLNSVQNGNWVAVEQSRESCQHQIEKIQPCCYKSMNQKLCILLRQQ